MLIKLVGSGEKLQQLKDLVVLSLQTLGFSDVVKMEESDDAAYKLELGITQNPALCIEEETIEFKDMIFEGIIPEKADIDAMFLSIFGGGEMDGASCGTGGCGSCSGGCH